MYKIKLFINFFLTITIILNCQILSSQTNNNIDTWTTQYIEALKNRQGLENWQNKDYNDPITRGEFSKLVYETFNLVETDTKPKKFDDISDIDPNAREIEVISSRGWLSGYEDGKFHPEYNLTRTQAIVVMSSAAGITLPGPELNFIQPTIANLILWGFYQDHSDIPRWAKLGIASASWRQMIIIESSIQNQNDRRLFLRPLDHITFGETISLIYLALSKIKPNQFPPIPVPSGVIVTELENWPFAIWITAFISSGVLYFKEEYQKGILYYMYTYLNLLQNYNDSIWLKLIDLISMCIIGSLVIGLFIKPITIMQSFTSGLGWTAFIGLG